VSCTLLLSVFATTTYIHVYVLISAIPQYVNFTTSSAVKVPLENEASDLFGNCILFLLTYISLLQWWASTTSEVVYNYFLNYFVVVKLCT